MDGGNKFIFYFLFSFYDIRCSQGLIQGGVQGVQTPALLIKVPFYEKTVSINTTGNA